MSAPAAPTAAPTWAATAAPRPTPVTEAVLGLEFLAPSSQDSAPCNTPSVQIRCAAKVFFASEVDLLPGREHLCNTVATALVSHLQQITPDHPIYMDHVSFNHQSLYLSVSGLVTSEMALAIQSRLDPVTSWLTLPDFGPLAILIGDNAPQTQLTLHNVPPYWDAGLLTKAMDLVKVTVLAADRAVEPHSQKLRPTTWIITVPNGTAATVAKQITFQLPRPASPEDGEISPPSVTISTRLANPTPVLTLTQTQSTLSLAPLPAGAPPPPAPAWRRTLLSSRNQPSGPTPNPSSVPNPMPPLDRSRRGGGRGGRGAHRGRSNTGSGTAGGRGRIHSNHGGGTGDGNGGGGGSDLGGSSGTRAGGGGAQNGGRGIPGDDNGGSGAPSGGLLDGDGPAGAQRGANGTAGGSQGAQRGSDTQEGGTGDRSGTGDLPPRPNLDTMARQDTSTDGIQTRRKTAVAREAMLVTGGQFDALTNAEDQ